jgi:hypothetical protein
MTDRVDPALLDLAKGIPAATVQEGESVRGRVADEEVLLVRSGDELFAIGSHCTHYHGPLADGSLSATRSAVRGITPASAWTGEARAPALDPVSCFAWSATVTAFVSAARWTSHGRRFRSSPGKADHPASIIIVGGGALVWRPPTCCAAKVRRAGDDDHGDTDPPIDRPNLSRTITRSGAGRLIPLRSPEFYTERNIDLLLRTCLDHRSGRARFG